MRNRSLAAWVAAGLFLSAAGAALALDAAGVVQARQAHFKTIGKASKGIFDELKSGAPRASVIQGYAAQLDQLAPQLPSWFPPGSGPDVAPRTHAKPGVWTEAASFKTDADRFAAAAHHFNQTAQAGDINAIRIEFTGLTKTCGACHSQFRTKDE